MRLTWTGKALENFMSVTSSLDPQKLMKVHEDGARWHETPTVMVLKDINMLTLATAFTDGSYVLTPTWNRIAV